MSVTDKTILFGKNEDDVENRHAAMVLEEVFAALKEAGHNPVIQLVGYLVSDLYHQSSRCTENNFRH